MRVRVSRSALSWLSMIELCAPPGFSVRETWAAFKDRFPDGFDAPAMKFTLSTLIDPEVRIITSAQQAVTTGFKDLRELKAHGLIEGERVRMTCG